MGELAIKELRLPALFAANCQCFASKDALSKNGVVVVLGSLDGKTVAWARASTGMPEGNESMLLDLRNNLKGVPLNVASILGTPTVDLATHQWKHTNSALEKILWGEHAFTRVHMGGAKDGQNSTGYAYLLREVEPSGWQKFGILLFMSFMGFVGWGICIYHGAPAYRSSFR